MKQVILFIVYWAKWLLSYKDYSICNRTVTFTGRHTIRSKTYIPPLDVTDLIVKFDYYFNNKKYKYITQFPEHDWPPVSQGMSCILPVKEVQLLDEDDKPIEDVTDIFKQHAGPKGDFHGEDFSLKEIFGEPSKIKITNIANMHKIMDHSSSVLLAR